MPVRKPHAALVYVAFLFGAYQADASILQEAGFQGHRYFLLDEASWSDSQIEAQSLGGNLVTINGAAENEFILNTFGPTVLGLVGTPIGSHNVSLWIGLNDLAVEGQWEWVSGEPVTYTNWASGEPAGRATDEDVAGIYLGGVTGLEPGVWHDITISLQASGFDITYGVVEVIPVPAALPSLASALAGLVLLGWRRKPAA